MSFSQQLRAAIADKHLLKHPFYQAWNEGRLTLDDLQVYANQYYPQVAMFPRCVSAVHSLCEDVQGRKVLVENLVEEEGMSGEGHSDHPELWMWFAEGVGGTRDDVRATEAFSETEKLNEEFFGLCRSSYAEGLGALYTYEYQIPEISTVKIDGLKKFYNIDDARSLAFFSVHEKADIEHSKACEAMLDRLDADGQAKALAAAEKTAQSLWDFLSGVEKHTLALRGACGCTAH